jgi:hypothetical protein
MILASDPSYSSVRCMYWDACHFAEGPLRFLLARVTADPQGMLEDARRCRVLASARCMLRNGTVYGISLQGPRDALTGACRVLAGVLAQHDYDESAFISIDRAIAGALQAAGYDAVRASLERNAPVCPRPVVDAAQVERLMLAVVNRHRSAHDGEPLASLPDALRSQPGGGDGGGDPAVAAYEQLLDVHGRTYSAGLRAVHGQSLDRLAVYNYIAARPGASRFRAQALQTLPWLLPMLSAPERGRISREVALIRGAVDDGAPLHDAVACAFDVPREVVRWLGGRTLPDSWQLDDVRVQRLLAALSWLPPERRPQSGAEFEDLMALCTVLARIVRFRNERGDLRMHAWAVRHGACMRRWLAECRQLGWAHDTRRRDPEAFATACTDASDFMATLVGAVQDRHGVGDEAAVTLAMRWTAGIGLRRLLGLSTQWHAQAFAGIEEPVPAGDAVDWPAILPEAMRFGDVAVVELTSSAQLAAEGRIMGHCVASYDQACYRGRSAIVSLRALSGAVRSTAELHLVEDGSMGVTVVQHRSAHNGAPDAGCVDALDTLVRYLNDEGAEPLLRARELFQRRQRQCARREADVRRGQAQEVAWRLAGGIPGPRP